LENLTQLEWLNLSHNRLTGAGLQYLSGMSKLRHLDLSHNQVADNGLQLILQRTI
jgi:Leucine-rich repeat (LRR) protein